LSAVIAGAVSILPVNTTQYIVASAWVLLICADLSLLFFTLFFKIRKQKFARKLLDLARESGSRRLQISIENYLSPRQANPYPIAREIGVCSIAQKPFYESHEFPFLDILESEYPVIRREMEAVFQDGRGFRTYFYGSVGGPGWETFHFHEGRKRIVENTERCPETTRIIESIPGFFTRHPVYSLLRAGASAAPHRDNSNVTLNCHLGLMVPKTDCGIRVGAETRTWTEGKCLVIDTSYEHEIWNFSNQPRVVLQITFFRPELTEDEKKWWVRMFHGGTYP
jgi:beta-hydroxylase